MKSEEKEKPFFSDVKNFLHQCLRYFLGIYMQNESKYRGGVAHALRSNMWKVHIVELNFVLSIFPPLAMFLPFNHLLYARHFTTAVSFNPYNSMN